MALLDLKDISISYGAEPLLDHASIEVEKGERVCLIGRNGAGKSTLMKAINGEIVPDSGEIIRQRGTTTAMLGQRVPHGESATVFEIVAGGLGPRGDLIMEYHQASARLETDGGSEAIEALGQLQERIDAEDAWDLELEVETVLSKLDLPAEAAFDKLSGGLKRRVVLGRALVSHPTILMLDEPTNHLDIEAIRWLEEFLERSVPTLLFVTHDRQFLRKLATRIVELDRGQLISYDCGYDKYLERREEYLQAEAKQRAVFDKKLAQEEAWIRQGIKARRTRNEGRVRALKKMRDERVARREVQGTANLAVQEAARSGQKVITAKKISFSYDDETIVSDFSTTIMRGDKIGVIGRNGSGKTTLLQLLLGKLQPDSGEVLHGTNMEVAYFDQLRGQLDDEKTVAENVQPRGDTVNFNGESRHIYSYLQDFLFSPDRARSPIRMLSGGERNRLLLAKLFIKPSNVLVMDEPTNDLDLETLDLLEELLLNYSGTLLLVSHDRAFLNNVVTSVIAMEGKGRVREVVGGYDDWQRLVEREQKADKSAKAAKATAKPQEPKADKPRKLSYREQQELSAIPAKIEKLENEQTKAQKAMLDPEWFKRNPAEIKRMEQRQSEIERELETLYARWEELESIGS